MTLVAQTAWIRPCTRIWLLLMGLSCVTYLIGVSGLNGLWAALLVLAFAIMKGQLIGDFYMGLRWVKGPWRWVVALWLLIPGALITTAFVLTSRATG